ncbi:galactose oxidase [Patescibacteria group bacterium]|nr:MAG: galactose oxidase [Patescibacteria group bacterium]
MLIMNKKPSFLKLLPFQILLRAIEFRDKPDRVLRGSNTLINGAVGKFSTAAPLPSWRYEFAAGVLEGKIYIIGGVWLPSVWFPTRLVEVYDAKNEVWKSIAPYPRLIHHTAAVTCQGKLYVVGGNGVRIHPLACVYAYDSGKNRWMRKADLPTARGALGVASVGDRIYAVGGGINKRAVNILEEYDPLAGRWTARAPMPTAREHTVAVAADGRVFVLGGYSGNRFNNLVANEVYDPKDNTWKVLSPLPYPVSGLSAAALGDSIFIFGGEQGWAVSPEVHEYKIKEDRWIRRNNLPVARYALTASTVGNSIHVIGGSGYLMGDDFRDEHEVFTL